MAIVPPDLGLVLDLAKKFGYHEQEHCFTDGERLLYVVPCGTPGARYYQATSARERTLSRSTYLLLRSGVQCATAPHVFESPPGSGDLYSLDDEHTEVVARGR